MNLIFRLLKTLIMCFFRPKLGLFDTSIVKVRVWPNDLDHNLHLTNSKYFSFMDLGRMDIMHRIGQFGLMRKHKWAAVMGSATLKWRFSLELFDQCEIHSRVIGWEGKYFYMYQRVMKDGQIACDGILKAVVISKEGPLQVSDVLKAFWGHEEESPELPDSVKHLSSIETSLSSEGKEYVKTLS